MSYAVLMLLRLFCLVIPDSTTVAMNEHFQSMQFLRRSFGRGLLFQGLKIVPRRIVFVS